MRADLADFKQIKDALGGTVNDVVLAVVSGALREWLHSRGVRTEGLELRALVPVSVRADGEHDTLGNRIVAMRGPLPVYVDDPVARLRVVRQAMDGLKESKQAVGAERAGRRAGLRPADGARAGLAAELLHAPLQPDRDERPRPAVPALRGRAPRCADLFPVAFLPRNHALAIAIMSYDGELNFGLLGDYDALPDIDRIARGLSDAVDELTELGAREGGQPAGPQRPRRREAR